MRKWGFALATLAAALGCDGAMSSDAGSGDAEVEPRLDASPGADAGPGLDAGPDGDAGRDRDAGTGPDGGAPDGGASADGGTDAGRCQTVFVDQDGDGYSPGGTMTVCDGVVPDGYTESSLGGDCDDEDPDVNEGATDDPGDAVDEDCSGNPLDQDGDGVLAPADGGTDCDDTQGHLWDAVEAYVDEDGDGVGAGPAVQACVTPESMVTPAQGQLVPGYSVLDGDCDDANPAAQPGYIDIPLDGVDDDCAGGDADLTGAFFVDGAAHGEGTGTRTDPFSSLADGVAAAVASGAARAVVVVARGIYEEQIIVDSSIELLVAGGYEHDGTGGWTRGGGDTIVAPSTAPTVRVSGSGTVSPTLQIARLELRGATVSGAGATVGRAGTVREGALILRHARVVGCEVVVTSALGNAFSNVLRFVTGRGYFHDTEIVGGDATGANDATTTGITAASGSELHLVGSRLGAGSATPQNGDALVAIINQVGGRLRIHDSRLDGTSSVTATPATIPARGRALSLDGLAGGLILTDSVVKAPEMNLAGTERRAESIGLRARRTRVIAHRNVIEGGDATGASASTAGVVLDEVPNAWLRGNSIEAGHGTGTRGTIRSVGVELNTASGIVLEANRIVSGVPTLNVDASATDPEAAAFGIRTGAAEMLLVNNEIASSGVQGSGVADTRSASLELFGNNSLTSVHNVYYTGRTSWADADSRALTFHLASSGDTLVSVNDVLLPGRADEVVGIERSGQGDAHLRHTAFASLEGDLFGQGLVRVAVAGTTTAYDSIADLEGCSAWTLGCGSVEGVFTGASHFVAPLGAFDARDYHLDGPGDLVDVGLDPRRVDYGTIGVPAPAALFDRDFEGELRPQGAGWDVGLDELASSP